MSEQLRRQQMYASDAASAAAAEDAARLIEEIDNHLAQVEESWALLKDVVGGPAEDEPEPSPARWADFLDARRRAIEYLWAGGRNADDIARALSTDQEVVRQIHQSTLERRAEEDRVAMDRAAESIRRKGADAKRRLDGEWKPSDPVWPPSETTP